MYKEMEKQRGYKTSYKEEHGDQKLQQQSMTAESGD